MYIDVKYLFWGIIGVIGAVALVYLIITLNHLCKLIKNANELLDSNKKNINVFCESLPEVSKNLNGICENVKDISDVATEVTAEAIVAKENIFSHYETIKDILEIILNVFVKK